MLKNAKINLVKTEKEFEELREFGLQYDHELQPEHKSCAIYAIRDYNGKLLSFFFIRQVPIVFTAWHPDINPRTMVEVINGIVTWDEIDSENTGRPRGFVAKNVGNKVFTEEVMQKLGFENFNVELFRPKE